jgi:hypothetical protein
VAPLQSGMIGSFSDLVLFKFVDRPVQSIGPYLVQDV